MLRASRPALRRAGAGAPRPPRASAGSSQSAAPAAAQTHDRRAVAPPSTPSSAPAKVWHQVGPSLSVIVDPLVAARAARSSDDDGLGGPGCEAVAQALWLRRLAEEQRDTLLERGRLAPMPEPLAVRDAAAAAAAAAALRRDGAVFLRGVVPGALCEMLKGDVDARADLAKRQLGSGLRRVDALLDWDGAARAAALAAAGPGGVAAVLAALLDAGADAQLVEFSVLSTEPGAARQVLHPDARADATHAPLFSLFVALQDVTDAMGPTTFVLGTHDAATHAALPAGPLTPAGAARLRAAAAVDAAPLRRGDAVLYDARTFHAGGANDAAKGARRGLLTLTFMRGPVPAAPQRRNSSGSEFSIKAEVMQLRLTAQRMAQMAAEEAAAASGSGGDGDDAFTRADTAASRPSPLREPALCR